MLKYILILFLIITNAYAYTCEEMGYTKTIADCPDGGLKCPAEPEKMFCCDPCGNQGGYRYDESNCSPDDGLVLAGVKCGDKWTECRGCSSEYKYNKDNCRAPKILAGVQCGNAYTQCVYPVGSGCVPTVGYIYYADGSCHADYDDTKEPLGVIMDAANKLVIGFDSDYFVAWTTDGDIPLNKVATDDVLDDRKGKEYTDIVMAYAKETGNEYKAVQYCANKTDGGRDWYLPALGELIVVCEKYEVINNAMNLVPNAKKLNTSQYWTSSYSGNGHFWAITNITTCTKGGGSRKEARKVPCVFTFK